MLLSNKFCSSFITSLKDNKPFLKESSLRLLEESITNYKRVMLYELSFNFDTSLIELKIGRDLIINNIDDHDYPKFGYREMGFSDSLPIKELIFKEIHNWNDSLNYTLVRNSIKEDFNLRIILRLEPKIRQIVSFAHQDYLNGICRR